MEQRKYIRVPVRKIQATLKTDSGQQLQAVINEFSDRGALLYFSGVIPSDIHKDDEITLKVVPDTEHPQDCFSVTALVRHRRNQQMGIKFLQVPRILLEIMRRKVQVMPPEKHASTPQHLMRDLQDQATRYFASALKSFLEQSDERILAAMDVVQTDVGRTALQESLTLFRASSEALVKRFMAHMQAAMQQTGTETGVNSYAQQTQIRQLSLIEKDEFESWLVIKVLVTKAETANREVLMSLQLRLDEMTKSPAGKQFNPFAPLVICEALKRSLAESSGIARIERLLYRAFDERVLAQLGELYKDLNQLMVKHHILPDLDLIRHWVSSNRSSESKNQTSPSPAAVPSAERKGEENRQVDPPVSGFTEKPLRRGQVSTASLSRLSADIAQQQQIVRAAYATAMRLTEMVHGTGRSDRDVQPEPVPLRQAERYSLQDVLGRMQQQAPNESVLKELQKTLEQQGLGLSKQDVSTCQMVDGLISSMTEMDTLNEAAEPWFSRLRIPLLRLALDNEQVFQVDQHPARLILNRLARLGTKGQVLTAPQKEDIQSVIQQIQQAETVDEQVFSQCLPVLDRLVQRQDALVERNLQRVAQVAEGEQRRDLARQAVDEELDRLLAGQEVPRALVVLLESGWHDLLVMTCVRDGAQGEAWARYWSVVTDLLASGHDSQVGLDLRELLTRIKQGLLAAGTSLISDTEQHIQQELKLLFNPEKGIGNIPRVLVKPVLRPLIPKATEQISEDPLLLRCMRRSRQLQAGDWIEMQRNERAEHLRLAWVGRDHARFVFVNHQGMKMCDFSLLDLATLMRDEHLRILETPPQSPVDDALERMVQSMYDQLTWASTHDELTGLVNRREFEKILEKAIEMSRRTRVRHVLIHLDIDHLALVNAEAGYQSGDQYLTQIVKIMEGVKHGKRVLARLGGDEFGVLLENCAHDRAQQLAVQLMQSVAEFRFAVGEKIFQLTACMGVVEATHQSESGDSLLRAADSACRQAKEIPGGNRIQWFVPGDQEQAQRQDVMTWVSRINQALEEDRLELRCQKIAPLSPAGEQAGVHYEILLSMQNEEGALISPGTFMQAAERYGRMLAVDRWVIASVLRWMQEHRQTLAMSGSFSINLSGHSMNDESLMEFIFQQFSLYEVPREKICFEVTETTAIANLADAADFIREMKKIGCRFALDDFGAGMSSYAYLKNLPVDFIKIDGSFIKNLHVDPHDCAMVKSIQEMSKQLGILTIAEYVENPAILSKLQDIGVDFVQGYTIEKPILLRDLAQQQHFS